MFIIYVLLLLFCYKTIIGNEGHGVRTNILKRCTHLVKISGNNNNNLDNVDSLNVSVTGGIILHHFLSKTK